MSIHERANGTWEVRWRDGPRQRSKTCADKDEAEAFEREVAKRPSAIGSMVHAALVVEATMDAAEMRRAADFTESMAATTRGVTAELAEGIAWALRKRADEKEETAT